jgi:hypothetical protein
MKWRLRIKKRSGVNRDHAIVFGIVASWAEYKPVFVILDEIRILITATDILEYFARNSPTLCEKAKALFHNSWSDVAGVEDNQSLSDQPWVNNKLFADAVTCWLSFSFLYFEVSARHRVHFAT